MHSDNRAISLTVNGTTRRETVSTRLLLSDFIRGQLALTGTHVGCEHGVCGCCTVLLDGKPVRSCLMLAVQVADHELMTVESLAGEDGSLHPLQDAFRQEHALQCGFCTAGILMTLVAFLEDNPNPTLHETREALSGNLCRCTGYVNIIAAVHRYVKESPS